MAKLPHVRSPIPQDLRNFIDRAREAIAALEVAGERAAGPAARLPGNAPTNTAGENYATPHVPFNVSATPTATQVALAWDAPGYTGHGYAEVRRNTVDDVFSATVVGWSPGVGLVDAVGAAGTFYYWVRFFNKAGAPGPYHSVAGVSATTQPPSHNTQIAGHQGGAPGERYHLLAAEAAQVAGIVARGTDAVAEGAGNLYHTAARVLATLLAGVNTGSAGTVTDSDSVLTALGKLQAQAVALATGKADAAHTHSIADTAGLQAALDGKANTGDVSGGLEPLVVFGPADPSTPDFMTTTDGDILMA